MTYIAGIRLPEDIERGALGGPRFNTSVLELDSGFEKRNQNWQDTRAEYDAGYGLLEKFDADPTSLKLDIDKLVHFFYTVRGKAFSFRFKDWVDYEVGSENGVDISAQFLHFGDDTTTIIQLFKRYNFEASTNPHDRLLTKIVASSYEFFLDGTPIPEGAGAGEFQIDIDTGLMTLGTAPASTGGTGPGGEEVVTGRFEFDVHARLDTDDLKINLEMFNAGSWPSVPLVELLGTGIAAP
jgi:uncharacterized protein (TIGR02217 family)